MYTSIKHHWFKFFFWTLTSATLLAMVLGASLWTIALAQDPTPGSGDVYVTVNYSDQINVRSGPGTILYDVIGSMQPGESAKALGVSPGHEWVKIVFPSGPDGVGWVYGSFISISPGNLPVVEPPPTTTPLTTPTIDPTLAAAYTFQPTETRMPTFTVPPPLEIPQFTAMPVARTQNRVPMGAFVILSGAIGLVSYLFSLLRRN
jgi:uncharacterized protein YraI